MSDGQAWAAELVDSSSGNAFCNSPAIVPDIDCEGLTTASSQEAIIGNSELNYWHHQQKHNMNPAPKKPDYSTYVGRVAAHIRKLRVKAGLSVPEFAERVSELSGVSVNVSTAYGWENGNNTPVIKMLPAIANALGVKKVRNVLPPE